MSKDELVAELRRRCAEAGTISDWAKGHGLSAIYISDVLNGRRGVGRKLLKAMNAVERKSYELLED